MPTIKIEVKNKIISVADESIVVSYNKDYKVEFSFDKEWENENIKTARFVFGGKSVDVVIDGNVCDLPMIDKAVSIGVGVYAGDLHSTNKAFIPCIQSVLEEKGSPTTPPKDVYGQIIDLLNKYIEQGGGGGINREEVEKIVEEYLSQNPAQDGFSPIVEISEIENGTRVSITDKDGTKSFDVLNGKDGTLIDVSSKVEEQTLIIELKDKQGNVISSTEVTLPTQEVDLSGYVKNTDYATDIKPGIINGGYAANQAAYVNTTAGYGALAMYTIFINSASENCIRARKGAKYGNGVGVIAPDNMDLALKIAITTNTQTLTEEEKANACEWLGATKKEYVDNLPDKLTLTDDQKAKWKAWLESILA